MISQTLRDAVCQAFGFDRLSEMQERTSEAVSTGRDVLLLSPTGTGKTVAYLLGLAASARTLVGTSSGLASGVARQDVALVVVPGRELAQQVADVARCMPGLGHVVCCYGGHDMRVEQSRLSALLSESEHRPLSDACLAEARAEEGVSRAEGCHVAVGQSGRTSIAIVVGTPGRLLDHLERGSLDGRRVTTLVLDEYDKCMELGFADEMQRIVARLSAVRQRVLTSATRSGTLPPWASIPGCKVVEGEGFGAPSVSPGLATPSAQSRLESWQVASPVADKLETLCDLLCSLPQSAQVIVFSGYRESAERIAHHLFAQGIVCALYHGGLDQPVRDRALVRFRGQSLRVLVATDLAARGLDIPEVTHVVHYHLPADVETDTHRNGRTARAGASGTAIYIVGPDEALPPYVGLTIAGGMGERPSGSDDEVSDAGGHSTRLARQHKVPHFRLRPKGAPSAVRALFAPLYETVYIGRGKREKLSRGDVVGFFTKQGGLTADQLGRIDLYDHCAYVAVLREVVTAALDRVRGLKIKGMKTHYLVVSGS